MARRVLSRACSGLLAALALAAPAAANTGTLVKTNCGPAASATDGTMVWKAQKPDGVWDAYIGDGSCNGRPLLPAYDGQRGPSDITRDGRYVLLVTAVGGDRRTIGAAPGKGSGNAIQLYDRRTGRLSTLLAGAQKTQRGVIWPRFSADGTRIVWAQMVKTPFELPPWGDWTLHVADVDLAAGTLSHERSWHDPAGGASLSEAYGWVPGTHDIVFMSTTRPTSGSVRAMQLFTLPDDFDATTAPTRISPKMAPARAWQQPNDVYHEFAAFWPGDPDTLYTSIGANTLGGSDIFAYDLRTAGPDGLLGQARRVSWFGGDVNKDLGASAIPGFPQPRYAAVVAMAWERNAWVAGICPDPNCSRMDAYRVTDALHPLSPVPAPTPVPAPSATPEPVPEPPAAPAPAQRPADRVAPRVRGVVLRRRHGAPVLDYRLSERAHVRLTVRRVHHRRVRVVRATGHAGANRVRLRRHRLRPGVYRVQLVARDVAGNVRRARARCRLAP